MKNAPMKDKIFIIVSTIVIVSIVFITMYGARDGGVLQYFPYISYLLLFYFLAIIGYAFFRFAQNNKFARKDIDLIAENMDPDEKIRIIEERYEKGKHKNYPIGYFNHLSLIYYEKGDYVKALELIRRAYDLAPNKAEGKWGMIMPTDICRSNEATYLIALGQLDLAERLLNLLEGKHCRNLVFRSAFAGNRARIAIGRGDAATARSYLAAGQELLYNKPCESSFYWLLLIAAECDLLEGNRQAALTKLDQIALYCTYFPTVRQAAVLKASLEQVSNDKGGEAPDGH